MVLLRTAVVSISQFLIYLFWVTTTVKSMGFNVSYAKQSETRYMLTKVSKAGAALSSLIISSKITRLKLIYTYVPTPLLTAVQTKPLTFQY